jgi:hypothetical protein
MRLDLSEAYVRAAASDLFTLGLDAFAQWMRGQTANEPSNVLPAERDAATLLDVDPDASPDEVRAALRAKIIEGGAHPDHGGDGVRARELIAAQNLLLARARDRLTGGSDRG